ncbi:hypothetical protein MTR_6g086615 [Medicago truncatula]|uniref:Uncharacterized protein n=1 Tax=Medicago truncatula TaxID=3880 RepID=G8A2I3_MEDTR|nr:hypothetical protein MTR_6g086615 [Medicago truncatula]
MQICCKILSDLLLIEKLEFSWPCWFLVGAKPLIQRILDLNPEHVRTFFGEQDFFIKIFLVSSLGVITSHAIERFNGFVVFL